MKECAGVLRFFPYQLLYRVVGLEEGPIQLRNSANGQSTENTGFIAHEQDVMEQVIQVQLARNRLKRADSVIPNKWRLGTISGCTPHLGAGKVAKIHKPFETKSHGLEPNSDGLQPAMASKV